MESRGHTAHTLAYHWALEVCTSSASRLRDFMNQDDVLGLANFVHVSLQLSCPCRQAMPRCQELVHELESWSALPVNSSSILKGIQGW
eukprot:1140326-Pelagomonas_calceolata.AAC.1